MLQNSAATHTCPQDTTPPFQILPKTTFAIPYYPLADTLERVALRWQFLTTWSPDNIFQKSVLRRHQSSLSPVHSAGGRRRSGSQALRRMVAEVKKSGWVSVGGMEKLMVTLRLAWLVGGLCITEHCRSCELRAPPCECACALAPVRLSFEKLWHRNLRALASPCTEITARNRWNVSCKMQWDF